MAEICRLLTQDPVPTTRPQGPGFGRVAERIMPVWMVRVGGRDLTDEFLDGQIQSIAVDDTARGLSKAKIVVNNDKLRFTDHELLAGENLEVEVHTGWSATKLVRRGQFRAAVPKYAFRNMAVPLVTLECYGEEWPLTISEEREVYENLRDSEIAQRIARRNRLQADVDQTDPVFEHVAQLNVTDMEFLENRALMYGYDVYVQDGVLHFHAPRFEHSDLVLVYGGGEKGILNSFQVCVDPWVRGAAWTKSGIDRVTGEEWEFRETSSLDPVAQEIKSRGGPGFKTGSSLAEVNGEQPRRFIVGDGHEGSEGEARRQVRGYARASEWVVFGSAEVRGIEVMRPRTVVTISGVGHLSGDYYVTRAVHRIDSKKGYTVQFEVTRPGVGRLEDRFQPSSRTGSADRRNVTAQSEQAGSAEILGA